MRKAQTLYSIAIVVFLYFLIKTSVSQRRRRLRTKNSVCNSQTSNDKEFCGYNVTATAENQTLTSPCWPQDYGNNMNCTWWIKASIGKQVKFTFLTFITENNFDLVHVSESNNPTLLSGRPLKSYPSTYYSSDGSLKLQFESDSSVTDKGFKGVFSEVSSAPKEASESGKKIGKCGHYINATQQYTVLTSPNWPYNYANDLNCEWILMARPGHHVEFKLQTFHTEKCCDYLTILNGNKILVIVRGNLPRRHTYVSKSYFMRVWFRSDNRVRFSGFKGVFKEIDYLPNDTQAGYVIQTPSKKKLAIAASPKYYCKNGLSIKLSLLCDGNPDCPDGSDEITTSNFISQNTSKEIECYFSEHDRKCMINRNYFCNHTVKCAGLSFCEVGCSSHYNCMNGSCQPTSTLCDSHLCNGCQEDTEWNNGPGFKCIRNGQQCFLPQQLLRDNYPDCDYGDDLCYIFNPKDYTKERELLTPPLVLNRSRCFECLDHSLVISLRRVCNGAIDCPDLSDECLCNEAPPEICKNVSMKTVPFSLLVSTPADKLCPVGQVACGIDKCINRTLICNGIVDCPNNGDELYSFCRGTLSCSDGLPENAKTKCRCHTHCKANVGELCNGIADCPPPNGTSYRWTKLPGFPADECASSCPATPGFDCTKNAVTLRRRRGPPSSVLCANTESEDTVGTGLPSPTKQFKMTGSKICDGIVDCTLNLADEINCPNRFTCQSGNFISIPTSEVCDGIANCENQEDEVKSKCTDRFYCNASRTKKVSISKKLVCDFEMNCDDGSDEKNCTDGRFYCLSGSVMYVLRSKVFDGTGDCEDYSDECPKDEDNVFSSRNKLIQNIILQICVWIMGLLAIFGNLVVIISQCKVLSASLPESTPASLRANRVFVLNLAIADLLMGIYLIMLGTVSFLNNKDFCVHRNTWLTSNTCAVMGILVVISSETSVITIVYLTAARLYAIFKPISSSINPKRPLLLLMIALAWIASIFLAFIPLFPSVQNTFVTRALIPQNPFFERPVVNFTSAQIWAEKLVTYDPKFTKNSEATLEQLEGATNWYSLQKVLEENSALSYYFRPNQFFGYYSASSVCIPRIYLTSQDQSSGFSISLTVFNFFSFTFVACSYGYIIMKSRKSSSRMRRKQAATLTGIEKKIVRIIITDFCCWMPITIMALLSLNGVPLSSLAYAVSAIILLPINSALNPILYSNLIDILMDKFKKSSNQTHTYENTTPSRSNITRFELTSTNQLHQK